MLTSSPSRQHRHPGRTAAVIVVALVVLVALAGAGYAVSHKNKSPDKSPAAPPRPTIVASASVAPTPTPGDVPFIALPVGAPPSGAGDAAYAWHALAATLRGRAKVGGGTTDSFTVTLHNPTSAPISLTPCPSYDLTVGMRTASYGLNCAPVPVIAPGASVTFTLPVPFPSNLSGTTVAVTWSLGWNPDPRSPRAHLSTMVR